jgi:hypothetical protein
MVKQLTRADSALHNNVDLLRSAVFDRCAHEQQQKRWRRWQEQHVQ